MVPCIQRALLSISPLYTLLHLNLLSVFVPVKPLLVTLQKLDFFTLFWCFFELRAKPGMYCFLATKFHSAKFFKSIISFYVYLWMIRNWFSPCHLKTEGFFFPFLVAPWLMEFPDQGLDPSRSCDLSCSCGYMGILTHCAGRGSKLPPSIPKMLLISLCHRGNPQQKSLTRFTWFIYLCNQVRVETTFIRHILQNKYLFMGGCEISAPTLPITYCMVVSKSLRALVHSSF